MKIKSVRALAFLVQLTWLAVANAAPVTIQVTGLPEPKGRIFINLFAGEQSWDAEKPSLVASIDSLVGSQASTTLNLPEGDYAFFLFQDLDNDGDLRRGFFGKPAEPYAFSNNVKIAFSKPSWKKLKFSVTKSGATQTVLLTVP